MGAATEVDPTFALVAKALYGDSVDERELWDVVKSMPGSSDVHADASPKRKKLLATGLVAGTAAEGLAAGRTIRPAVRAIRNVTGDVTPIKRALYVGEMGLQTANAAVGLTAAATLANQGKKRKGSITKAVVPHTQPEALIHSRARLRRIQKGSITPVSKGYRQAVRMTEHLASAEHRSFLAGIKTDAMKQQFEGRTGRSVPGHAATPPRGRHREARRVGALVPVAAASAAAGGASVEAIHRKGSAPVSKSVDLTFTGTISKVDTDKRQVFGWCSLSEVDGKPVVDLQGDYVPIEEIEKSAYAYVLESRVGGDMHRRIQKFDAGPVHTADLIESIVFTPEKIEKLGLPPGSIPLGWWVGYKVNDDEQWNLVKSGHRLGFSIHGSGVRKDLDLGVSKAVRLGAPEPKKVPAIPPKPAKLAIKFVRKVPR